MSNANAAFTFEGHNVTIQCSQNERMRIICQRYATKIGINFNSLLFLYGGNQLNLDLSFNEHANSIDKKNNVMNILVYKNESNDFACPKCGEKINLNGEKFNNIILSNDKIKEAIKGIIFQIDNIINNRTISISNINIQLKNMNIILNTIKEDIKKNNTKFKNLLNDFVNINNSFKKVSAKPANIEPNKNVKLNQNQITSPNVKVIRKGSGIDMNTQQNIINCAVKTFQRNLKPISNCTASAIKKAIGEDWIVINYPNEKLADFNITFVKGNCYLSFTVDSWTFHVMKI